MSSLRIQELPHYIGQRVIIDGWLYNKRTSGKIQFPIVRDGSGYLQCVVVKKEVDLDHMVARTASSALRAFPFLP